jgi:ADP-heptose:LPS heptosyltransferase
MPHSTANLPAPDVAARASSQRSRALGQELMLTEHEAAQLLDKLEKMIETTGAPSPLLQNMSLLAPKLLTPDLAFKQIDHLKSLGAARWPDAAVRMQLLQYRLYLAENSLSEAADVMWQSWQRPYLVKNAGVLARQVVAASTICLTAGDLAGVKRWLDWGEFYFRFRHARGWFEVVDWLVDYTAAEFKSPVVPWRFGDRMAVRLRKLKRWCETGNLGRVPRMLREKAGNLIDLVAHAVYRTRSRADVQASAWHSPTIPPLDTLEAIRSGIRNGGAGGDHCGPSSGNGSRAMEQPANRAGILITRAMGGIGDFLMMTPGLHALARRTGGERIVVAIPAKYFPIFEGNPDLKLIDIEAEPIDVSRFSQWINLTDCPAARVESASVPRIKQNRIDIFARALGADDRAVRAMNLQPRYFFSEEDRRFQDEFWKSHQLQGRVVVGVQLKSQDSYKDYAGMTEIVKQLAQRYHVLVFHSHRLKDTGQESPAGVTNVFGYPLRQAFSLVARCNVVVCPDSAFVHFAGAINLPCVALFGPTDGSVFTRHYPNTVYLDCRDRLGCIPCWRNQYSTCRLSQGGNSVCMQMLPHTEVLQAVDAQIRKNAALAARGEPAPALDA